MNAISIIALLQSIYFAVTGVWPLVHIHSFMAVTGPKLDLWLVKTIGVLIVAVAIPIGLSAIHNRVTPEIMLLATLSAAALAAVDVVYVTKKVISKIYLLDALAEAVLIAAWLFAWRWA